MDERAREIDLYWKRASYFWTLIAVAFGGYFAVLTKATGSQVSSDALLIIACLGSLFSLGWFCVNRGSKYWQENWEMHVDLLEEQVYGSLHQINLRHTGWQWIRIHEAYPYSVTKINQLLSIFVLLIWLCLLLQASYPYNCCSTSGEWLPFVALTLTGGFATLMLTVGQTTSPSSKPDRRLGERSNRVVPDPPVNKVEPVPIPTTPD